MILYHGTSAATARDIERSGIKSFSHSGVSPVTKFEHGKVHYYPHPEAVYLTRAQALLYGWRAAHVVEPDSNHVCLIEVDISRLAESDLLPDEDFVFQLILGKIYEAERRVPGRGEMVEILEYAKKNLKKFSKLWMASLQEMDNCAYLRDIPQDALCRFVFPDPKSLEPYRSFFVKGHDLFHTPMAMDETGLKKVFLLRFFFRALQKSLTLPNTPTNGSTAPLAIEWPFLWWKAIEGFRVQVGSPHGPGHWATVEEIGLHLAPATGADVELVRLFSVLHDACRQSDGHDPQHGHRAAQLAHEWRAAHFPTVDDARFALLCDALRYHADGQTSSDPTIGTCWDADRLHLSRVGIEPSPKYLSTEAAKCSGNILIPNQIKAA